ncbi:aldehyde dehydrogenase [Striga asiatica]|uniref:Aldehyde dehydrogenase n=1 Tax=Striga asiatica TaxID=4170 RepID=A0A5A7NX86_STRAF|nr:aldehyde dehydrogenase [Striga asiatica]
MNRNSRCFLAIVSKLTPFRKHTTQDPRLHCNIFRKEEYHNSANHVNIEQDSGGREHGSKHFFILQGNRMFKANANAQKENGAYPLVQMVAYKTPSKHCQMKKDSNLNIWKRGKQHQQLSGEV